MPRLCPTRRGVNRRIEEVNGRGRTVSVHWHVEIFNLAVNTEDLLQVVIRDVLGELLNHDLPILAAAHHYKF